MQVRVNICLDCRDKLRAVLERKDERAMAKAMGDILCSSCKSKIPGYDPRTRLVIKLKERQ